MRVLFRRRYVTLLMFIKHKTYMDKTKEQTINIKIYKRAASSQGSYQFGVLALTDVVLQMTTRGRKNLCWEEKGKYNLSLWLRRLLGEEAELKFETSVCCGNVAFLSRSLFRSRTTAEVSMSLKDCMHVWCVAIGSDGLSRICDDIGSRWVLFMS